MHMKIIHKILHVDISNVNKMNKTIDTSIKIFISDKYIDI